MYFLLFWQSIRPTRLQTQPPSSPSSVMRPVRSASLCRSSLFLQMEATPPSSSPRTLALENRRVAGVCCRSLCLCPCLCRTSARGRPWTFPKVLQGTGAAGRLTEPARKRKLPWQRLWREAGLCRSRTLQKLPTFSLRWSQTVRENNRGGTWSRQGGVSLGGVRHRLGTSLSRFLLALGRRSGAGLDQRTNQGERECGEGYCTWITSLFIMYFFIFNLVWSFLSCRHTSPPAPCICVQLKPVDGNVWPLVRVAACKHSGSSCLALYHVEFCFGGNPHVEALKMPPALRALVSGYSRDLQCRWRRGRGG